MAHPEDCTAHAAANAENGSSPLQRGQLVRHGTGAIPGHPFGLDLATADRAALIELLKAL